jgi:hypothetical protein
MNSKDRKYDVKCDSLLRNVLKKRGKLEYEVGSNGRMEK